ncbi:uncharacterized protein LOC124131604 [Haliotis rufescens]|uniref:uncharacterized protein LOC124131604 n=1 Tax=Haliotis rufescens TaxID=6454 RepID=UPI00201F0CBA|nr:uncharacterized protein LOC124131604 [Haliotis rufescens]
MATSSLVKLVSWRLAGVALLRRTNLAVPRPRLLCTHTGVPTEDTGHRVFSATERIPKRFDAEIQKVMQEHSDKIDGYATIMNCPRVVVESLIQADTRLVTSFTYEQIRAKMKMFVDFGFSPEEISTYPAVFCRSYNDSKRRLAEMETVRKYHFSLRMVYVSEREFRRRIALYRKELSILGDHPTKVHFVAAKLNCDVTDVLDMIDKGNTHLMTRPPSAIDNLVDMILEYGFTTEQIRESPQVLIASLKLARHRFVLVKDSDVLNRMSLFTILGTNLSQFRASLRTWLLELAHLDGCEDCDCVLRRRLGVDENTVKAMHIRATKLKYLRARKIQPCLDILLKEMEIAPGDIVKQPVVLYFSPDRLLRRKAILEEAGVEGSWNRLNALCLSEAKFEIKYEDYIKKSDESVT